jgi:anti-sigma factor ChrR (cupin superfamily)
MQDELLGSLMLALTPIEPPRKDILRQRVIERIQEPADTHDHDTITIRAQSGVWTELVPGVRMKRLHRDGVARSYLLRLEPGAALPEHRHEGDEECIVLEGEVFLGDVRVAAGDFHVARGGTTHAKLSSANGALLFIRNAGGMPHPI